MLDQLISAIVPKTLGVTISKKALKAGITVPEREFPGDGGFDLRTAEAVTVEPGKVGRFPTGLNFNLPTHASKRPVRIGLLIIARGGLATDHGLIPMAVLVDSGYRADDEDGLVLSLRNLGTKTLTFAPGDRVAQMVLIPIWTPEIKVISPEEMDETTRAAGRFGSTGIKT